LSKIAVLREAIEAVLYDGTQDDLAGGLRSAAEDLILEFEKNELYIQCLHSGGVDNWDWYGDSLSEYWEKYG